jgi:hypothetical protein
LQLILNLKKPAYWQHSPAHFLAGNWGTPLLAKLMCQRAILILFYFIFPQSQMSSSISSVLIEKVDIYPIGTIKIVTA